MSLNETPMANRVHIGFFGCRNAGKSSLVNKLTNQDIAVVSDTAGTTTDPVKKAMEILPIGPVMIIDTPGYDDVGELGEMRVARTRRILNRTDAAVLVADAKSGLRSADRELIELFEKNNIKIIRLGLHYSDSLVNNSYGDNYHPAFKELCENKLFYDKFIEKAKDFPDLNEIKTVVINSKSLSKFLGQKRSNVNKLNELGYNFSVCFDDTLQKYELYLK